jgi:anaerobic selenocysteine-containing dehydrogenase
MNGSINKIITACALCYHNCGTEVMVKEGNIVKIEGQKSHPMNKGWLCPKGRATIEYIYHPDRLKYPLKRNGSEWERITWDQALSEIANKMAGLKEAYGPSSLGFFCGSVGVENLEMVALTHRLKAALGSPNFFSVESVCYRMRIRCRQITFGKYPIEELDSNLYILWGHNPAESDFPLAIAIEENLKKGAKVVVIDPMKIPLADRAEMYLRIRPGTDGALALAMIYVIVKEKLYDADFVEKWTYGFEKLVPHVQAYTPEWAEKITWVPAEETRKLARLFAHTKGAGIYQGTCTQDQSANGSQTDRAFAILQSLTGNINVPGGWVVSPRLKLGNAALPVEGRPLGTDQYPLFYEVWGRKSPYAVVSMLPESIPSQVRAIFSVGGNPLVTMPDTNAFRGAFKRLDLLVVYDLMMTETAKMADYVLPACSHLEGWGLAYNYNVCHCLPYLMIRKKAIEPFYESRSILDLYRGLADKMGLKEKFPWASEEELVAFEMEPSGLTFENLMQSKPEGAYYQEKVYETLDGSFPTPSGKIEFYSEAFKKVGFDPLPTYREPEKSPQGTRWTELGHKYPLILTTGIRSIYYTNSQFRHIESLKLNYSAPTAEIGPKTAETYGITHGESIVIESDRGSIRMRASVSDRVAEGIVLIPHGWPGDSNANLLTDAICREPIMGYPQWKGLLCSIRKV